MNKQTSIENDRIELLKNHCFYCVDITTSLEANDALLRKEARKQRDGNLPKKSNQITQWNHCGLISWRKSRQAHAVWNRENP